VNISIVKNSIIWHADCKVCIVREGLIIHPRFGHKTHTIGIEPVTNMKAAKTTSKIAPFHW
jgi:hypothetical protein